jgi:membrane-bound serine protease (ClpP class)
MRLAMRSLMGNSCKTSRLRRAAAAFALALAGIPGSCNPEAIPPLAAATIPDGVTHMRIEGELDVGTLGLLKRAVAAAHAGGHRHLIVEIDTPGGPIDLMWRIAHVISDESKDGLEIVAWVHDHAVSAGVLVALACDKIYMTPQATIGSAMPVTLGASGIEALPEEDGTREKVTSAMRSQFRAMAEARHRSPALAEAMVDSNVEVREVLEGGTRKLITGKEWDDVRAAGNPPELVRTVVRRGELLNLSASQAVELGFADGLAGSLTEVIEKIGVAKATVVSVERSRSEDVLAWLDRLSPLLLIAGLVLGYMEFKMPGFGLPGILSIACFALLLVGRYLAGLADIPHIVAVALGAALIATEIFVLPGTLWLGIAGALLVVFGLIWSSLAPGFAFGNPLDQQMILDATFNLMASALVALVAALLLSRLLPKAPILRGLVLVPEGGPAGSLAATVEPVEAARAPAVGDRGRALTSLRPVGKVELARDPAVEHEARAIGAWIERDAPVRVVEISAGRLVVEALASDSATGDER